MIIPKDENKYAILIECDPGNTLGGSCWRDVKNMAIHLIDRCTFIPKNIFILTTNTPNNKNMIQGEKYQGINYKNARTDIFKTYEDILKCDAEQIVILASGHGFSVRDNNNDEPDGKDEAINVGRQIADDEFYSGIVNKCASNCNLVLLSDTCHSGTMFDLNLVYDPNKKDWIKSTKRFTDNNQKQNIISLSACSDSQLSMCDIGDVTGFGGSLTTAVLNLPNVLEDMINHQKIIEAYEKVQNSLKLLGQTVILSKH